MTDRDEWRKRFLSDLDAQRVMELAEVALWLSRSALWLHIPQLANAPTGKMGSTMLDAVEVLRREYPGDFPLDKVGGSVSPRRN